MLLYILLPFSVADMQQHINEELNFPSLWLQCKCLSPSLQSMVRTCTDRGQIKETDRTVFKSRPLEMFLVLFGTIKLD